MPYTRHVKFLFARSARRHKIGRAHALAALTKAGEPIQLPNLDYLWIASDDRGIELEIIGFRAQEDENLVIVKHVIPTDLRRKP